MQQQWSSSADLLVCRPSGSSSDDGRECAYGTPSRPLAASGRGQASGHAGLLEDAARPLSGCASWWLTIDQRASPPGRASMRVSVRRLLNWEGDDHGNYSVRICMRPGIRVRGGSECPGASATWLRWMASGCQRRLQLTCRCNTFDASVVLAYKALAYSAPVSPCPWGWQGRRRDRHFTWAGGVADPIKMDFYVSQENAFQIKASTAWVEDDPVKSLACGSPTTIRKQRNGSSRPTRSG